MSFWVPTEDRVPMLDLTSDPTQPFLPHAETDPQKLQEEIRKYHSNKAQYPVSMVIISPNKAHKDLAAVCNYTSSEAMISDFVSDAGILAYDMWRYQHNYLRSDQVTGPVNINVKIPSTISTILRRISDELMVRKYLLQHRLPAMAPNQKKKKKKPHFP